MLEGEGELDASTESSTGTESQSEGATQTDNNATGVETGAQQKQTENLPFHEHPRFKELVEQKNQFAEQSRQYQRQLQEFQARIARMEQERTQAQRKEDALHARLKGIDPEFGERFSKLDSSLAEVAQLKEQLAQYQLQQVRQQGINMVNQLHADNKVSKEMQELYNSQIEDVLRRDPNLGLKDLTGVYKSVHDRMSKLFEGFKRADRESYVADKKKDATAPSTGANKGKAPAPAKDSIKWSKDPFEARQQMVAEVRKQLAAERNAD